MKRYLPFLAVAAAIAAVPVFAQVANLNPQKKIPGLPSIQIIPPKWTPFEYQVFEIRDPPPGGIAVGPPSIDSEGRIIFGRARSPIEIGNLQFQELSNEMGRLGWELIQLAPRVETGTTKSYRAVFKRETKQTTVKTGG